MPCKRISGVYKITNKLNGKFYVGSSLNVTKRKLTHFMYLRKNLHPNKKLQNSWNKHGESAFEFFILEVVENKEHLIMREQHWLNYFNAVENGYNILKLAYSPTGWTPSDETREKMSISQTGRKHSPETRAKMSAWQMGRKFSDESRKKMSEKAKGRTFSKETRERMSIAKKGRKPSEESKATMRKAQREIVFRNNSLDICTRKSA